MTPANNSKVIVAFVGFFFALVLAFTAFFSSRQEAPRMAAAALARSHRHAQVLPRTAASQPRTSPAQIPTAPKAAAALKVESAKPAGAGQASYYGTEFAGRPTANGERFNPAAMTAAHRSLPFGARVRVTNVKNGRSVIVRINDRGPYAKRRVIDVSRGAAQQLGMVSAGTAQVKLEVLAG
jgi:rare lipoprotein A